MSIFRGSRWSVATISLFCILSGCAPKTSIATNKDQNYVREPQRLMVIEAMGTPLGKDTEKFQDTLRQGIKDCHIFTNYVVTPPEMSKARLSVDEKVVKAVQEWDAKRDAFIRQFAPDTVLDIAESQYTVRTVSTQYGAVTSSSIPQIIYELALTDIPTKKTVWKGQVTLFTGGVLVRTGNDPGTQLAKDIVAKLSQDGIFHTCPPADTQ